MTTLIQAELLKLRTTRLPLIYLATALLFVPVTVALAITTGDDLTPLDSSEGIRNVMSAASSGGLLVLLLGVLSMAGEFRHNTAVTTFLISPDRRRVIQAKMIVGAAVGFGLAAVASVLTLAVAVPWLGARDVDVELLSRDVGAPLLGALLATALYAVLGVALGALITNQTVAVVVALVWVTTVESILVAFLPEVGRWLPGGAASSLAGTATAEGGLLPLWGAALVLVAYASAFGLGGARLLARRTI